MKLRSCESSHDRKINLNHLIMNFIDFVSESLCFSVRTLGGNPKTKKMELSAYNHRSGIHNKKKFASVEDKRLKDKDYLCKTTGII